LVIFLGAGFSRDAYLPVMNDFWKRSEESLESLNRKHSTQDRNSPGFRESASLLIEAGSEFRLFRERCRGSGALRFQDADNLEKIFCIAEALREADVLNIQLDRQDCNTDKLIQQIQLWVWKIYQEFPFWNDERKNFTNQKAYDDFFEALKKYGVNKTAVLTTNYDLIFECFAWQHRFPCFYGGGPFEDISAGYGSQRYVYYNEAAHFDKPVVCKLHGSVNYFCNPSSCKRDKISVASDLGNKQPILCSGVWENKPAIFALDAISNIRNKYGNNLTPEIIPPTYAKLTQQSWLRQIWHRALQALVDAEKIIFVGYSFPESDGFMTALMQGAIMQRDGKPLKVYVIDPCTTTHQRYQSLFPEAYQWLGLKTFSDAPWEILR